AGAGWWAWAICTSRASLQARPVNWMPVGRSFRPKPLGTARAGWPTALPAWISGGPPPTPGYALLKSVSSGKETVASDGATMASYLLYNSSMAFFIRHRPAHLHALAVVPRQHHRRRVAAPAVVDGPQLTRLAALDEVAEGAGPLRLDDQADHLAPGHARQLHVLDDLRELAEDLERL